MRAVRLSLTVVSSGLFALLLETNALAVSTVAVVTAGAGAEPAAHYLETQLDHPAVRRHSENARHLDALVAEARAGWHEELVVIVDTERAVVSVVRPEDGTIGSRRLGIARSSRSFSSPSSNSSAHRSSSRSRPTRWA